ncbi:unnamed protein product [Linum tenue]|uniref:Uncharacterized protein n=1 Tax=Linum tenue TaxID=586396 RepID=A0AAV0H868_9ROSI|nr:unnamed protein product [Linum tenue]
MASVCASSPVATVSSPRQVTLILDHLRDPSGSAAALLLRGSTTPFLATSAWTHWPRIFISGFLTKISNLNTLSWYTTGEQEYFTDTTTLFIVELIFIDCARGA